MHTTVSWTPCGLKLTSISWHSNDLPQRSHPVVKVGLRAAHQDDGAAFMVGGGACREAATVNPAHTLARCLRSFSLLTVGRVKLILLRRHKMKTTDQLLCCFHLPPIVCFNFFLFNKKKTLCDVTKDIGHWQYSLARCWLHISSKTALFFARDPIRASAVASCWS